ncbi:hypothetical protein [Stenotrophomonas sp. PD6]|uniref:hypothetical protein n=1 Tax=Stenotrophomonas sp. PD6 TaxID=3368612 RepID=UPI003B9F01BD
MHKDSPYQASSTAPAPEHAQLRANQVPHAIGGPVKHMWIAALVLAAMSLAGDGIALANLYAGFQLGDQALIVVLFTAAGALFNVGILLGLAWGIHRYSRTAACALLAFYLLGQLALLWVGQLTVLKGLSLTVIFSFVMIRGTLATFAYHRHLKQEARRPPRTRISDDPAFAPKADPAP